MKVKELVEILQKCDQDAEVTLAESRNDWKNWDTVADMPNGESLAVSKHAGGGRFQ